MKRARLSGLRKRAADLLAIAHPVRCRYLEVVRLASEEELLQLAAGPNPDADLVHALAGKIEEDAAVVIDILTRFVRNDLRDPTPRYSELKQFFDESDLDVRQSVQRYLDEGQEQVELSFLLHDELSGWDGQRGSLLDAPVFESFEEDGGDDAAFEHALCGYLVAHDRAFPTVVDLLGTARQQRWPLWEMLWRQWF
jgi:hypothetical protein